MTSNPHTTIDRTQLAQVSRIDSQRVLALRPPEMHELLTAS